MGAKLGMMLAQICLSKNTCAHLSSLGLAIPLAHLGFFVKWVERDGRPGADGRQLNTSQQLGLAAGYYAFA